MRRPGLTPQTRKEKPNARLRLFNIPLYEAARQNGLNGQGNLKKKIWVFCVRTRYSVGIVFRERNGIPFIACCVLWAQPGKGLCAYNCMKRRSCEIRELAPVVYSREAVGIDYDHGSLERSTHFSSLSRRSRSELVLIRASLRAGNENRLKVLDYRISNTHVVKRDFEKFPSTGFVALRRLLSFNFVLRFPQILYIASHLAIIFVSNTLHWHIPHSKSKEVAYFGSMRQVYHSFKYLAFIHSILGFQGIAPPQTEGAYLCTKLARTPSSPRSLENPFGSGNCMPAGMGLLDPSFTTFRVFAWKTAFKKWLDLRVSSLDMPPCFVFFAILTDVRIDLGTPRLNLQFRFRLQELSSKWREEHSCIKAAIKAVFMWRKSEASGVHPMCLSPLHNGFVNFKLESRLHPREPPEGIDAGYEVLQSVEVRLYVLVSRTYVAEYGYTATYPSYRTRFDSEFEPRDITISNRNDSNSSYDYTFALRNSLILLVKVTETYYTAFGWAVRYGTEYILLEALITASEGWDLVVLIVRPIGF
ncbi:uncharacterized protein BDR25DRAFT_356810 [Lindgomyces ingoldianus]|uniref:Uncharacterized protein n=1 Tax=Lindgomyces ingoldianus TaxID=673940 RepID=A0ACB6QPX3_9PLEO|nr:uncharacterized protein BDR25DRAFT_356810 [Lindgomyces ingoldianus]KAF2469048.1 hypothetical protein BDR25DRAFT_356810 [Lindgomyces ingoldianus]